MNNKVKKIVSAIALSAAALTPLALAQTNKGAPAAPGGAASSAPAQPGVPMGPTKAGPNAAVTGSTTAAGNSGAPAQSVPASASSTSAKTTPGTAMAKPLSSSDRSFITKAAQAGIAEVEAGKLAQANGANADVKKFGERMQQDHSKAGDELKALAQSKGFTPPDQADRSHERLAKQLKGLTGARFDTVYAREAGVKDHKAAVALFTRQAQKGNDPDVKAFAAKTLPTLQEHLKMAQAMHDSVMAPAKR